MTNFELLEGSNTLFSQLVMSFGTKSKLTAKVPPSNQGLGSVAYFYLNRDYQ